MDVAALSLAALGFFIASSGWHLLGALLTTVALSGLLVYLRRSRKPYTLFNFRYPGFYVSAAAAVVLYLALARTFRWAPALIIAFVLYLYVAVALRERVV